MRESGGQSVIGHHPLHLAVEDVAASAAWYQGALGFHHVSTARDASVADPDGYHLTFSYGPVDPELTIEDVADRVATR